MTSLIIQTIVSSLGPTHVRVNTTVHIVNFWVQVVSLSAPLVGVPVCPRLQLFFVLFGNSAIHHSGVKLPPD
jgi:hypothetical protein